MAINLMKGQKVDLTKGNPRLRNLLVRLGWDTNKYTGGSDFDLDESTHSEVMRFNLGEDFSII